MNTWSSVGRMWSNIRHVLSNISFETFLQQGVPSFIFHILFLFPSKFHFILSFSCVLSELSCLSGRFGFKMKHSALLGYQYNKHSRKYWQVHLMYFVIMKLKFLDWLRRLFCARTFRGLTENLRGASTVFKYVLHLLKWEIGVLTMSAAF